MKNLKSVFNLVVLLALIFSSCSDANNKRIPADVVTNPHSATGNSGSGLPVITFDKDVHDFGKVIQGEKLSVGFKFKNTGNADLVIAQVSASCGCTVPKYPKTAIKPGAEEVITVMYDSGGQKGIQNKAITIVTNCQPPNSVIRIKAIVIVP